MCIERKPFTPDRFASSQNGVVQKTRDASILARDVQERDVTPDPPPVACSVRGNSASIARLLPPSNFSRVFLPIRASGGVSSYPDRRTNRLSPPGNSPTIALENNVAKAKCARRIPARDLRPRRWLPVRRDRSATIENRVIPCLSSNCIARWRKRAYRGRVTRWSTCSRLKNRRTVILNRTIDLLWGIP